MAAGALSSALIPIVAGLFERDEDDHAWRVVSTVINLMLVALAVARGRAVRRSRPGRSCAITPGFDAGAAELTVDLTRIMLLSPILLALGAVATSVLNARGRFAAAAIAPIVYNLAIIGGALLLAPTLGVEGLAIGVVAGSLGHLLVQLRPLPRARLPVRTRGSTGATRRHDGRCVLMAPRAIGLGANQITFIVVTALASTLGRRRGDRLQRRLHAAPDPDRGHRRPARRSSCCRRSRGTRRSVARRSSLAC